MKFQVGQRNSFNEILILANYVLSPSRGILAGGDKYSVELGKRALLTRTNVERRPATN